MSPTNNTIILLGNPNLKQVALGVKFLKRATTASTYNERHRLLQKRLPSATSSPSLEDCLEEPYFLESGEPEWLDEDSWLTDETMAPLVEGPTRFTNSDPYRRPAWIWYSGLEDPDTGPAYIWYRDHEECNQTDHVSSAAFRASREVAYVMMDISRRHAMTQFKGCDVSRRWYHVDEDKRQNEIYEKIRTCELREDIYRRGGRGWWSENDYSQIKWLYSTP